MARATNFDELREMMDRMFEHGDADNEAFKPRPSDVIISPAGKSGTTWLQQMVHSIRTGGRHTAYEDIYEVVPWIDMATRLGLDLDADQPAEPRAFKSHRTWDDVPQGCRYIVSFRDPKDVAVSTYRFFEGWLMEPDAIELEHFVATLFDDTEREGSYWHHTTSWLTQRDNPDVLLLTFDDMKQDLPGVVRRVAAFLGTPLGDDEFARAVELSGFAYMSANPGPFQDPWLSAWTREHLDLDHDDAASSKVRVGEVGANRRELEPATAARIDGLWAAKVGAEAGVMTYEDLVDELRVARAA